MAKNTIKSRIGMFNLFKGVGMIAVIAAHSFGTDVFANQLFILALFLLPFGGAIMPAFMAISGYGFRAIEMKKGVRQQVNLLLRPYLYVAVAASILHLLTRYILTGSVSKALSLTWYVIGGFLMGLPYQRNVGGVLFYNCGPMWYIVALFGGWFVLNLIMRCVPQKFISVTVVGVAVIGWLLGFVEFTFFCLPQSFIAAFFIYIGYLMKHRKVIANGLSIKYWISWGCLTLIVAVGAIITNKMDDMADSTWAFGILSVLFEGYLSVGWVWIGAWLGSRRFPGKTILETIGIKSLYIFAVHTVELHGIPWYLITNRFSGRPLFASGLIFILRVLFIFIGVKLIENRKIFLSLFRKSAK